MEPTAQTSCVVAADRRKDSLVLSCSMLESVPSRQQLLVTPQENGLFRVLGFYLVIPTTSD